MTPWMMITLLAQDPPAQPEVSPWSSFLIIMVPTLLFMIIMQTVFGRSDSKEKAKRDELISSLKKNDTVVTIGGILGTYVSASADKTEVTIKVDDGTRLRMQASAIREVVTKESKESTESAKS